MFSGIYNLSGACGQSVSSIADIESEISEIIQGNVRNLIRGKKDIKIEKLSTLHKIYLENQWKSNNKFVWNKNSLLVVEELAKINKYKYKQKK